MVAFLSYKLKNINKNWFLSFVLLFRVYLGFQVIDFAKQALKLKATKFCILNSALYWKDPGAILLNFLV